MVLHTGLLYGFGYANPLPLSQAQLAKSGVFCVLPPSFFRGEATLSLPVQNPLK